MDEDTADAEGAAAHEPDSPDAEDIGKADVQELPGTTDLADSPAGAPSDDPGDPDNDQPRLRLTVTDLNRGVPGEVIIHYPQRDVVFNCDGESALRLVGVISGRHDRRPASLEDPLTDDSRAWHGWIAFDVVAPLAVSWTPHLDDRPSRFGVIDPVPGGRGAAVALAFDAAVGAAAHRA
jgi:hypothetical protein